MFVIIFTSCIFENGSNGSKNKSKNFLMLLFKNKGTDKKKIESKKDNDNEVINSDHLVEKENNIINNNSSAQSENNITDNNSNAQNENDITDNNSNAQNENDITDNNSTAQNENDIINNKSTAQNENDIINNKSPDEIIIPKGTKSYKVVENDLNPSLSGSTKSDKIANSFKWTIIVGIGILVIIAILIFVIKFIHNKKRNSSTSR